MRSVLLVFITLFITSFCWGQNHFGIFAGPQATTTSYKVNGVKQENKFKYGFMAGAGFKLPFEGKLYFAPALFYSMKGYKVNFTQYASPPDVNAIDNNTTIHCLELAALLQYDFSDQPGHVFIKGGPSLDFLLFGNEKYNLAGGGSIDRKMPFSLGSDYGHFSGNLLAQLGYESANGFVIFAQYTHGLANINNTDRGPQIRNRAYGISIGKYFSRKKIVIDTRNRE